MNAFIKDIHIALNIVLNDSMLTWTQIFTNMECTKDRMSDIKIRKHFQLDHLVRQVKKCFRVHVNSVVLSVLSLLPLTPKLPSTDKHPTCLPHSCTLRHRPVLSNFITRGTYIEEWFEIFLLEAAASSLFHCC